MIASDRNIFLGVHLTKEVKEGLRKLAKDNKMSMSLLVYKVLKSHVDRQERKKKTRD